MSDRASVFDVAHELDPTAIARAQRVVAAHAHDADDCRALLAGLGILPGAAPEPENDPTR
ncbi:hypothetical protein P3H15_44320 [Rhodococcus sp. T2V]|uniref:hypothetical protein n=1 Tax=Rhodococcus sp. T2V TaxID=3034164 RepID=UPI0023E1951E|nr:hypothetical protein [Rhodococcus sp. T2V]MDF3312004.1 hypothetical protein [Rhodococcus sp. T2V]